MQYYGINGQSLVVCSSNYIGQIDAGVLISKADNPSNEQQGMILERILNTLQVNDIDVVQGQFFHPQSVQIAVYCGIKGTTKDTILGMCGIFLTPLYPGSKVYTISRTFPQTQYDALYLTCSVVIRSSAQPSSGKYYIPITSPTNNKYLLIESISDRVYFSIVTGIQPGSEPMDVVEDFVINLDLPVSNLIKINGILDNKIPDLEEQIGDLEQNMNKINGNVQSYYIAR